MEDYEGTAVKSMEILKAKHEEKLEKCEAEAKQKF